MFPEIDGYAVEGELGRGGMGVVYAAEHLATRRPVALKLLTEVRPRAVVRFRREVRAVARLSHPNVIGVRDQGTHDGVPFLVMDRAAGPLPTAHWGLAALQEVLLALLSALAHAHARQVLHLDLKPSNVLVDRAGRPLLADFGVAQLRDEGSGLTGGTPAFMAPEQLRGDADALGPWTDLFALGCTAYRLATGLSPFPEVDAGGQLAVRMDGPDALPAGRVPEHLEGWLRRLLQPDPAQRFLHAADAAFALRRLELDDAVAPEVPANSKDPTWTMSGAVAPRLGPTPERLGQVDLPTVVSAPPPTRAADVVEAQGPLGATLFGLRTPPLLGRHADREALWALLRRVQEDGRPVTVAITGTPGTGRHRLATWLAEAAAEHGAAYAWALRGDLPDAALPLARRIATGFPRVPSALARRVERWATDPSDWVAVLRALLAHLGQSRPTVLLLDTPDDDATGALLEQLAATREPCPVLVVRTAVPDATPDGASVHPLSPLSVAEHQALVESLLPLQPGLVARIRDATLGSPRFAVELVRDWVARGVLRPTPEGFRLPVGAPLAVPEDTRAVLESRLASAADGADALRHLERAAILGSAVVRADWLAVCAASAGQLDVLAERLLETGLALPAPGGWSFAPPALRQVLLDGIRRQGRWQVEHLHCARALAAGTEVSDTGGGLGTLLWEAGVREEAVPRMLYEARAWQQRGMLGRAEVALDRIEQVCEALPDHHPLRAMALATRGFSLFQRGRAQEGLDLVRRARRADGSPPHPGYDLGFILQAHQDLALRVGAFSESVEAARLLCRLEGETPARRLHALARLWQSLRHAAQPDPGLLDQLVADADHLGEEPNDAVALQAATAALVAAGRLDDARRVGALGLACALCNSEGHEARMRNTLATLERQAGRPEAADAQLVAALACMERAGTSGTGVVRLNLAMSLLGRGKPGATRFLAEAARDLPASLEGGRLVLLAWAHALQGDGRALAVALDDAERELASGTPQDSVLQALEQVQEVLSGGALAAFAPRVEALAVSVRRQLGGAAVRPC